MILRPTVWSCRQNVAIHPSLRQQLTIAGILQTDPLAPLDSWNKKGTLFLICSHIVGSRTMLRMFVEEAAALASITLFIGMIAILAQVIPQL